ncbi:hypothetical protein LZ318_25425 [Saccharopolyspora indica]|uniref:NACHT and WD repeat domain-containing protein n=1 Tax=Saccharopolyspora indica TaxID=1229659 RepID=UPI0022EA8437|nr:AAA family ATPase [Saccharopolyspora indica]MDA3646549.1 hypothetical protein [Saccharopolyspora indica]
MQSDRNQVHQEATASGEARIYQAAGSQYFEHHEHYEHGVRRAEPATAAETCPYPTDMAAFRAEDAEWFFGRDRLTAQLVERVDHRVRAGGGPLIVVAPSGAGKSSLLQAGLIPKLIQGALPGSQHWPGLLLTPTARPVTALASQIAALTDADPDEVAEQIEQAPEQCAESVRALLRARTKQNGTGKLRLVVIVDQLEELFTMCGEQRQRHDFLDLIAHLTRNGANGEEPVAVAVYGLRSDFYTHCTDFPDLRAALQDGQLVLGPMSPEELRAAILNPAERAGLRVDAGLVDVLLRDLGATAGEGYEIGRLPLLAHALRATWLARHGTALTVDGYRQTGGIRDAVSTTAERAFAGLNPAQQRATRMLFLRLVKIGDGTEDTRRRIPHADLRSGGTDPETVQTVLDVFTRDRLLTQGRNTVEITHEVLLRAWPRLRDWIDEDRAGNLVRQQLDEAATAWRNEDRDADALYRGTRLKTAREQSRTGRGHDDLSPGAREFLDASIRHERRGGRRRRRQLTAVSVLTVLALIASVVAVLGQRAASERDVAAAGQLVSESLNPSTEPMLSKLESLAAWEINPSSDEVRYAIKVAAANPEYSLPALSDLAGQVGSVAYSPDGMTIAAVVDGSAYLWDVATGRQVGPALGTSVGSVAFNLDGTILATGSAGRGAQLWDVTTGHQIGPVLDSDSQVYSVAFSRDGKLLATGAANNSSGARLWDVGTGRQIGPTFDSDSQVYSAVFSPDGKTLATGTQGAGARLWDVGTGQQIGPQLGDTTVESVAFSRGGETLVTATGDGAQLWDRATGQQIGPTLSSAGNVEEVAFSPDGTTVVTATATAVRTSFNAPPSGGGAQLWDVATGRQIGPTLDDTTTVYSAAFSPDGSTLVTGVGSETGGGVRLWNLAASRQIGPTLDGSSYARSVAFNRDGTALAAGMFRGGARSWNVATGSQVRSVLGDSTVLSVAFSPDGNTLVTGADSETGGGARLWNLATGQQIGPVLGGPNTVSSVAFSKDGDTLATSLGDEGVRLWDVATGRQIGPTFGESGSMDVDAVALSPDGKTLAAAMGSAMGVQLWDVATGRPVGAALGSATVNSVQFSPDGETLATGLLLGGAQLWDVATGQRIGPTLGSGGLVSVAFSPDGETLAATADATNGGGVQLWDVATGRQIGPTVGNSVLVSVAFSPDGRTLATADPYVGAQLWNVDYLVDFQRVVCDEVGGFLTSEFWERHVPPGPAYRNVCA